MLNCLDTRYYQGPFFAISFILETPHSKSRFLQPLFQAFSEMEIEPNMRGTIPELILEYENYLKLDERQKRYSLIHSTGIAEMEIKNPESTSVLHLANLSDQLTMVDLLFFRFSGYVDYEFSFNDLFDPKGEFMALFKEIYLKLDFPAGVLCWEEDCRPLFESKPFRSTPREDFRLDKIDIKADEFQETTVVIAKSHYFQGKDMNVLPLANNAQLAILNESMLPKNRVPISKRYPWEPIGP